MDVRPQLPTSGARSSRTVRLGHHGAGPFLTPASCTRSCSVRGHRWNPVELDSPDAVCCQPASQHGARCTNYGFLHSSCGCTNQASLVRTEEAGVGVHLSPDPSAPDFSKLPGPARRYTTELPCRPRCGCPPRGRSLRPVQPILECRSVFADDYRGVTPRASCRRSRTRIQGRWPFSCDRVGELDVSICSDRAHSWQEVRRINFYSFDTHSLLHRLTWENRAYAQGCG